MRVHRAVGAHAFLDSLGRLAGGLEARGRLALAIGTAGRRRSLTSGPL